MARKSAVGLDIGTRSVNVAHVESGRNETRVVNFGGAELPPGAVREGEVVDTAAVADVIKDLLSAAKVKSKQVHLGIANQRVVVRQVDLPWMEPSELRTSLRFQVQEHIPIPVDEAELDFHVLDDYYADEETRMLRVLLVAAHKDMVSSHVAAATKAGLRPVGVDLNPFAMLRALGTDSPVESPSEVLVDVGAGVTNIVVHDQGVPRFVRILVLGSDDITNALESGLGIPFPDADDTKKQTGFQPTSDDVAARIIADHASQFVDEIRSSLDYYHAQSGGSRVSRVVLTGGGSLLQGLTERLETVLRLPIERGNPFRYLPTKNVAFGEEELQQVGPVLTTAIGLGLGGVE